MNYDPFEQGLSRLLDEEVAHDKKVLTPTWEKAWINRGPELGLAIRNEPGSAEPYHVYNIDFIVGLGLEKVLAKGLVQYAQTRAAGTVYSNIKYLKSGFCAFLNSPISGGKATRALWAAQQFAASDLAEFAKFMRALDVVNGTRDGMAHSFKNVMASYLAVAETDNPAYDAILALKKTTAFRNLAKNANSTTGDIRSAARREEKFIPLQRILAINDAAEADIRKITAEWHATQKLIGTGQKLLDERRPASLAEIKGIPMLLAWITREFPYCIPSHDELRRDHKDLINALKREGISLKDVRSMTHATSENILPFFILLLIRSRYNVDVLNGLSWSDIADRGDLITLAPYKNRARKIQPRSEPAGGRKDPLSLRSILSMLEAMTDRLRKTAQGVEEDRVFLIWSSGKGGVRAGFSSILKKNASGSFSEFLERHGLDPFRASDIRPTVLDIVSNGIEGLEGAMREGNHSEVITTLRHYLSIRTSVGRRITLAETPDQMDRWSQSGGATDSRYLPSNADLKSATPGFGCLNPYESPFPIDAPGRLCRSEGHCARCENAFLRSDDSKLVAYVIAYAEAAANATHLSPDAYDELLWGYTQFLSQVPIEIMEQALQLPKPSAQIR